MKRKHLLIVCVLLIIAFVLRYYRLAELMPFTFDQGRDMYALLQISRGDLSLIGPTTGLQGVFLGPFYFYFLLPGFLLSGGSPIGVAYWVALWTTLSLILFYQILKSIVGKWWAVYGLALLVLMFGSIDEARIIWNPSLAAPLLLISWWALFTSVRKPWLLALSALSYALSLQTELAYTLFLAPAYLWWVWQHRQKYSWKIVLMSAVIAGATLLPQVGFELRNNFIMTRSLFSEKTAEYHVPLTQLWSTRPEQIANAIEHRVFGTPLPLHVGFIAVLLTILWLTTQKLTPTERFFTLLFLLPIAGLMVHTSNYGYFFPYYLNPHYLPALALLVFAMRRWRWRTFVAPALGFVMVLYAFEFGKVIYNPSVLQYTLSHQLRALQAVRQLSTTETSGLAVFVPNLLPINYQYLNEWLAFSGQEKNITFELKDDQQEYFLLWENPADPYFFGPWYEGRTANAQCSTQGQFGILTLQRCQRQ